METDDIWGLSEGADEIEMVLQIFGSAVTRTTLAVLPLLLPGFGYKAGDIFFVQSEGAGAFLTVGENPLPAPVSQIALDCLAEHFLDRALLLLWRCPNFRN